MYNSYHRMPDSHLSVCQQSNHCGTFDAESVFLTLFKNKLIFFKKHVLVFSKNLVFNPKYKWNRKLRIVKIKFNKSIKF